MFMVKLETARESGGLERVLATDDGRRRNDPPQRLCATDARESNVRQVRMMSPGRTDQDGSHGMGERAAPTALALVLSVSAFDQGHEPAHSSTAAGNAVESNLAKRHSTGGSGDGSANSSPDLLLAWSEQRPRIPDA